MIIKVRGREHSNVLELRDAIRSVPDTRNENDSTVCGKYRK